MTFYCPLSAALPTLPSPAFAGAGPAATARRMGATGHSQADSPHHCMENYGSNAVLLGAWDASTSIVGSLVGRLTSSIAPCSQRFVNRLPEMLAMLRRASTQSTAEREHVKGTKRSQPYVSLSDHTMTLVRAPLW